jgi:DNA-binding response OmpR family regulator
MDEPRLILVVEDDEATRAFLLDNLAADGFRVAGASSAGEGVRGIEVRRPHLVVLDLALEGRERARPARPRAARRRPGVADRSGPARER